MTAFALLIPTAHLQLRTPLQSVQYLVAWRVRVAATVHDPYSSLVEGVLMGFGMKMVIEAELGEVGLGVLAGVHLEVTQEFLVISVGNCFAPIFLLLFHADVFYYSAIPVRNITTY